MLALLSHDTRVFTSRPSFFLWQEHGAKAGGHLLVYCPLLSFSASHWWLRWWSPRLARWHALGVHGLALLPLWLSGGWKFLSENAVDPLLN